MGRKLQKKRHMNILYLSADLGIPIHGHKGAAIHVRALVNAFNNLGHTVTLIAPKRNPEEGPLIDAKVIEVEIGKETISSSDQDFEQTACEVAQKIYLTAKGLMGQETFDFIYERYSLWSDAGSRLASETGLPLILEVNSPLLRETAQYRTLSNIALASRIETDNLKTASVLAVVSTPLKNYLMERGASPEKIRVIPNAVDEQLFHPAVDGNEIRSRLGLEDKFVVGFVGTVRPWHDLDTLISALVLQQSAPTEPVLRNGKHGGYHFLLVGRIPDEVRQKIAISNLGAITTYIDPVPNNEIPSYLAAMDVAVSPHPPLADFYFSPLKLFEYLASGVATIAADVPPIAQVITDRINGLLYSPGNAESLASQLTSLAADPALRKRLGIQGAMDMLQSHTWKDNARQIIHLINPADFSLHKKTGKEPMFDERLGGFLYLATRSDLAGPFLSKSLPNGFDQITNWEILKYNPGRRCVIAYEMAHKGHDDHKKTFIGKVFRDQQGMEYFNLQKELWLRGFHPNAVDAVTVPEPIAYIPELHMLLQEQSPGLTLDDHLDAPNFEDKVRASAAALAKLHACDIKPVKTYSLDSELANLRQWAEELERLRPELSARFREQLFRLEALADTLPPSELTPVHRDFHYGQILFSDSRITVIDLDLLALGDPAIDVANFAAHLQFLAVQFLSDPHELDGMAELFVKEYKNCHGTAQLDSRLTFYEAATFFRLLYVALTRPQYNAYFESLFAIGEQKTQVAVDRLSTL